MSWVTWKLFKTHKQKQCKSPLIVAELAWFQQYTDYALVHMYWDNNDSPNKWLGRAEVIWAVPGVITLCFLFIITTNAANVTNAEYV